MGLFSFVIVYDCATLLLSLYFPLHYSITVLQLFFDGISLPNRLKVVVVVTSHTLGGIGVNELHSLVKTVFVVYLQGYFCINYFPTPLKNMKFKFSACELPDKPQANYVQLLDWITVTDNTMDLQIIYLSRFIFIFKCPKMTKDFQIFFSDVESEIVQLAYKQLEQ